jgi:hypothetical protein
MKSLPDSIRKLSYAELEKNTEAHQDYVKLVNQNDKYRHVPLIRTDGAANLITSFKILFNPNESVQDERTRVGRFVDNLKDRWNQQIEPLLLTPE